ncbi:MAG: replication-relaxation family protein [Acidobacteriota bacterium]|nr:replication-relaxation family protein [Acidobacteriota bacterium]
MTDHKRGGADHRHIVVTERDRRLLGYVARFRLMSRDQVMALAPFGSLTRANTRLAALVRAGLLARKLLPVYPGRGSVQALYHLGKLSRGIVNAEPSFVERQVRQIARWDSRQTAHVVAANQVVVDFLAALDRSDGANADLRTETELRQMFHDRPLVPDGWLAWTHDGKRFNAFVEADLGTEGLLAWRRKVVNYLQYAESDAHAEHFGLRSFRVLVVAGSCQRLRHLREVSESAGRLFLFAQMRGVNRENFFDPIWLPAKGAHPIGLAEA